MADSVIINRGVGYALFAYDIALSINLDAAERHLSTSTQRESIQHRHPAPSYLEYRPAPVRVTQSVASLSFGAYQSGTNVDVILYDFGALSVIYRIPLAGPFTDLVALSEELYDNMLLIQDSRRRAEPLLAAIHPAVTKPGIADLVEDYVIFHIEDFATPCSPTTLCTMHDQEIARMLRAERQALAGQEVAEALSLHLSFSSNDMILIDWHAALLIDRAGEDVRSVLEFANVELLEMRYLDQRLDDALDRSYATLSRRLWGPLRVLGSYHADLRRVAQLQIDNAILFEGVNNALKLLGDQYLAGGYRLVSQRFHLAEWDTSILRKLQTLESIYEKMSDQAATYRLEVREWIVIMLIAVEILLSLFSGGSDH